MNKSEKDVEGGRKPNDRKEGRRGKKRTKDRKNDYNKGTMFVSIVFFHTEARLGLPLQSCWLD